MEMEDITSTSYNRRSERFENPVDISPLGGEMKKAKRHEISYEALRRLASSVGVHRVSKKVHEMFVRITEAFLKEIVSQAVANSDEAGRRVCYTYPIQNTGYGKRGRIVAASVATRGIYQKVAMGPHQTESD
ncbi:hypothetical protein KIN20_010164 [Parelaphostrongylus tenuis]|uniref:Uncharacterized protein n=1 Tax=Parelaphostrongylus tenuis TaxID=148309 RepID=A0AAD5M7H9_PARTN|nr:hypothetical protein KIN20_010164 [Parelaphostrongylus tenuis]